MRENKEKQVGGLVNLDIPKMIIKSSFLFNDSSLLLLRIPGAIKIIINKTCFNV